VIDWIESLLSAFESLGPFGYVLFILAYVLGTLLLIPESIFTILSGALFGAVFGSAVAWLCAITASFAAFFLSRTAFKKRIEKRVEKNKWLGAVNKALPKEGWKVVALARLSPLVPFGLQNYLFGVTKVRRRDYLAATALAILPGTVIYDPQTGQPLALLGGASGWTWAMLAGGIVASVALTLLLGRIAKKRLGL